MPSEMVCVRCGRTIEAGATIPSGFAVEKICEQCAAWQRLRGSDQEDRYSSTVPDALRPASGRHV